MGLTVAFLVLVKRLPAVLFCLAVCLVAFESSSALAETNYWTALDPSRLSSTCLAADPLTTSTVYAAGPGGVWKTTDSGRTWQYSSYGLRGPVTGLVPHPSSPGLLYASTGSGVFRTTDAGVRWTPIGNIEERRVDRLEIDHKDPHNLYAIAEGLETELLKSTDDGLSWTKLSLPQAASGTVYPLRIAVHPQDSQLLLLACWQGLFRSTDQGASWRSAGTWQDNRPTAFAFDPQDAGRIYAGASRGVWISTDKGDTWVKSGNDTMQEISTMVVDPANSSILYAGSHNSFVLDGGLWKSTDRGITWVTELKDLTATPIEDLLIDRSKPSRLWFATYQGLFLSEDSAMSWKPTTEGALRSGVILFAIAPSDSRVIYAAGSAGLVRSQDGGISWTPVSSYNALEPTRPFAIAVEPGNPQVVYVAGTQFLYRSDDGGQSWKVIGGIRADQIHINPANPQHVYVRDISRALRRSTDRGEIWITSKSDVSAIAFDPADSKRVYATGPDGIYRSTDAGLIWTYIPESAVTGYPTDLLVDPSDASSLWAASINKSGAPEIWNSADRGKTWFRRSVFPRGEIDHLVASPHSPLVLYASLPDGFSRSGDRAKTWVRFDHGAVAVRSEENCATALFALDPENASRLLAPSSQGLCHLVVSPSIHFPWAAADEAEYSTGLTLVNLSSVPLEVRLEAREPDGRLASGEGIENPKTLKLNPEEQTAAQVSELFGPLSANAFRGWVRAFIDREPVTAFFSIFSPDLKVLDTVDASQRLYASVIFPVIEENGETVLTVANPHPRAALTHFQLTDPAGVVKKEVARVVPADGRMAVAVGDLFGSGTEASDYVRAYSDLPLAFLELFGQHGRSVAGLNGLAASFSSPILIPQFVVGNSEVRSTLDLIASSTLPIPVTVTLRSDGGTVVGATVVNVGTAKTRLTGEQLFPSLAGQSITGYLELRQKDSLYEWQAAVTFEDAAGSRFLTALPSVTTPRSEYILSHLASDAGFFTGIAVVNPNNQATEVTIEVYAPDAQLLGSRTMLIPPNGRISKLLSEWVPVLQGVSIHGGYARLRSTQPVACFGVFAPSDLSSYAVVPAQ